MPRAEYVHRRTGTTNLHYERPVPPDLGAHPQSKWHGKQWAIRQSLRTPDIRTANEAARRLSVQWDEAFQAERDRLNPQTLEVLTREMTDTLVMRIKSRVLGADDEVRFDAAKLHSLLAAFEHIAPSNYIQFIAPLETPRPTPSYLKADPSWPESRGMRPDQLERLREVHELIGRSMRRAAASGNLGIARDIADEETRARGFRVNWDRPENRPALLAILRAKVSAWLDRGRRDAGDIIETPEAPEFTAIPTASKPSPQTGHTIANALELWTKERTRETKTLSVFTRHAEMFRSLMGDPTLEKLTRPDGLTFKDKVQAWAIDEKRTTSTANNVLSSVRTMLRLAMQRGWVEHDVLADVAVNIGGAEEVPRLPWSVADLSKLFDSPVFTAYQLPKAKGAGLDAAYWVPLLLAYFGGRPREVAQLWTDDVFETPGGLAIEFRENVDRGQKLKKKTGARVSPSWRVTPVHDRLIELGFADYWRAIAAHGVGQLFPALLPGGENGHAAGIGRWFSTHKASKGFAEEPKDLHSFRHTVRTELGLVGVSGDITKALIGHATDDAHDTSYGVTMRRRADDLRPFMNRLHYPGLILSRVFKAPAWKP